MAFLPFGQVCLKSLIRKEWDFVPRTLGEHLKKRRLILGLRQEDVALQLGVGPESVLHWEKGQTAPPISVIPRIIAFLGYEPYPAPETLSERMLAFRRRRGWSIEQAARDLGVDPGTWARWERQGEVPWKVYRDLLGERLARHLQP